jgi:hypothetical protein
MTDAAKAGWLNGAAIDTVAAKNIAATITASFLLCGADKTFFEPFRVVTLCYRRLLKINRHATG